MWYAVKNGFRNEIVLISVRKRYPVMFMCFNLYVYASVK
jgi:hypothetical protein